MEHVPPEVFGEDDLYFYEEWLDDDLSNSQAELIWETLQLRTGDEVLDVPCGHGRIANRLAQRGARVTGVDADAFFVEHARADAAARGVDVEYVHGDMRELPWDGRFDAAVNWFTSFGYFDDEGNRAWLETVRRTLSRGAGSRSTFTAATSSCATASRPRSPTERETSSSTATASTSRPAGRRKNAG